MKRQTRRMKDIAKRGLVGLLTVSMCLSNVQGIAFADNRVEVGGVKVDGKKVTLNLNGGSLMEAARAALAEANVYDDTYIAVSKDAKTQAAYRALTDGSNPLYELALFSDGELQALEDAGVEIVALIQMDQKQAEAAGNLMPATASEIERSSTKVEFFDPSKDEGKEILLYQPDSLFAGFYDQFSNQLMNASEKEIVSADPSTYELSGDEKVTFLFINHADAGRTFNLELNGESLEKGIKVAKAESVIKGVMSTLDVSGIEETLETPAPETSAAVTEPSSEAAAQPSEEAAAQPSTETAIEPSTEASGTAGESIVILPETGATAESGETETSVAVETSAAAQPSQDEANAETGLPAEGQTSTENTEQPAAEKTAAAAENTGIVDTVKDVIETIAENVNATMMKIERRLGVIRAEAAESDEAVVETQKVDEAPKAENTDEALKAEETPKTEVTPAAGTENEAPKPEETPAAGTENEAPKPEESPAAGTGIETPNPEETPAAGTENEAPKPEETPAAGTGIEAPKTEETTAAAAVETTAAVKTDMDIALENDRKALLKETRAANLVDGSVASARVLQYTLDDLSKSFWSAEITDRYEVNVFAEDTAFTENVKLELKELAKPEEAEDGTLATSDDTLTEAQVEALRADGSYENSQSIDIRFVDEDGKEVEPKTPVKVRIKVYKDALPEDADISTMAIKHLDESTGSVQTATVASYDDAADGTIKAVDEQGKKVELKSVDADTTEVADEEVEAASVAATTTKEVLPEEAVGLESTFTVKSFSGFTITWGYRHSSKAKVKFVDINGNDIGGSNAIADIAAGYGQTIDFNDRKYRPVVNGKEYALYRVKLASSNQDFSQAKDIPYQLTSYDDYGWGIYKWHYYVGKDRYGRAQYTDIKENEIIYLVCVEADQNLTEVETIPMPSGFHMYMTNYSGPAAVGSKYTANATPGLYSSTIAEGSEYPTLSDNRTSIRQWFPADEAHEVNHLFVEQTDPNSENYGYLYYNSAVYFATLINDGNVGKTFKVYEQLGTPSSEDRFFFQRGNFMPYNTLDTSRVLNFNKYNDEGGNLAATDSRYGENLYGLKGVGNTLDPDFYFGAYGKADFYQPKDGLVDSKPMVYEFTGDDDLVVYIDGILTLDLGGIHDALTGSINFATGEIKCTGNDANNTYLYDIFSEHEVGMINGQIDKDFWKQITTLDGETTYVFQDNSKHSIKFFYMERGAGASNLKLKINIPPTPDGSLNIIKDVKGLNEDQSKNEKFYFQLIDESSKQPIHVTNYTVGTDTRTPEDGLIWIYGGERAQVTGLEIGSEVRVKEVNVREVNARKIYTTTYESTDSNGNKNISSSDDGITVTIPPANSIEVKATNTFDAQYAKDLTVVKNFDVNGKISDPASSLAEGDYGNIEFILKEKTGDNTYTQVGKAVKYSDPKFTENGNSAQYVFKNLDATKVYIVEENRAKASNNGGTVDKLYSKTGYQIDEGNITWDESTADSTSTGEVSLTKDKTVVTFTNVYGTPSIDVTFEKVDRDDASKHLTDATFKLMKKSGETYSLVTDASGSAIEVTDGITVNLSAGEYQLIETQAPAGYNLLTGTVDFKVENGKVVENPIATSVSNDMYTIVSDGGSNVVTIKNKAGIKLPETGGMGTLMTTMSGMALMLIALGYLILVKRREKGGLN
ncbi:MAG: LPXTG cell wall anchor domain-containing protein [Oribacterium sp.]|nr:LPXTG cell wall anchor domain-containing protein [Oribacterium sp.]